MDSDNTQTLSLDDVLITHAMARRPQRRRDPSAIATAFEQLGRELAGDCRPVLQSVSEIAIGLCGADSAGVCVIETARPDLLHLCVASGPLSRYIGSRMRRDERPCGLAIERNAPQLFYEPSRHYAALARIEPRVFETLVVPWSVDGLVAGSLWACAHAPGERFYPGDMRLLADLGAFVAAAWRLNLALDAAKLACERERVKDEFLVTLAHELRNPLASISNVVELWRRERTDGPPPERPLEILTRQVRHVTRLVDDLLDVSRIARGKIDCNLQPTLLADVVNSAVQTCKPFFEKSGQALIVVLPDGPIRVLADAVRLEQIITNLLHNAAKYSEPGAQTRLTIARADDGSAEIAVLDRGAGIPEHQLAHIFEMFAQAHRNTTAGKRGLGIGLTMVRRLVELHGGQVEARSAGVGHGSEFVVHLPAFHGADATPQAQVADRITDNVVRATRDFAADASRKRATRPSRFLSGFPSMSRDMEHTLAVTTAVLRPDDYEVSCGQKVNALGSYIGYLRVRRKTDGKLIYPFDGCAVPGPFATPDEARRAALSMAQELVRLDIASPES
ncbi:HAMP domain-containing sensor histidine kinase [Paraburkholderia sp. SIMBA_009]|uniref:histidine kinase n=1 Tax=Paraburkholderia tropica TaxID=92647 RepID=A0AAQ1GN85_9BURK|nr:HAMP domain-containing sensor histidine kinase [Paraburkholderia tropica]SEK14227.1 Signal transduction histidine kinase [Paraburkholderia tropica]